MVNLKVPLHTQRPAFSMPVVCPSPVSPAPPSVRPSYKYAKGHTGPLSKGEREQAEMGIPFGVTTLLVAGAHYSGFGGGLCTVLSH